MLVSGLDSEQSTRLRLLLQIGDRMEFHTLYLPYVVPSIRCTFHTLYLPYIRIRCMRRTLCVRSSAFLSRTAKIETDSGHTRSYTRRPQRCRVPRIFPYPCCMYIFLTFLTLLSSSYCYWILFSIGSCIDYFALGILFSGYLRVGCVYEPWMCWPLANVAQASGSVA